MKINQEKLEKLIQKIENPGQQETHLLPKPELEIKIAQNQFIYVERAEDTKSLIYILENATDYLFLSELGDSKKTNLFNNVKEDTNYDQNNVLFRFKEAYYLTNWSPTKKYGLIGTNFGASKNLTNDKKNELKKYWTKSIQESIKSGYDNNKYYENSCFRYSDTGAFYPVIIKTYEEFIEENNITFEKLQELKEYQEQQQLLFYAKIMSDWITK